MIDIIVIGSGFGGAVMAARLTPALRRLRATGRLVVLEQGDDPSGLIDPSSLGGPLNAEGNRFRNTLDPAYLSTIAQLFTDPAQQFKRGSPSLTVAAGRAVGGGSQVYDGVSLRAPSEAFRQQRDGRPLWPARYTRASLDPYYATVEQRLKVRRLEWTDASVPHWQLTTKRDFVFAEGCRRIGATAVPLKVADDADANEGWWNEGQRLSGRQALTLNYLADARQAGAEIWSGCTVASVAPTASGYVVKGTDARAKRDFEFECRMVVVAAGAVGSSALLLSSREHFEGARELDPSNLLGEHLSANGDYGVSGIVGPSFEMNVETFKGKPMSSFCPSFYRNDGFIIIPFFAAPLYLSLGQFATVVRPKNPAAQGRASTDAAERDWGLAYKQRLKSFGSRMLTMGCLAYDACEGQVRLGPRGAEVSWRETSSQTEARWSKAVDTMGRIYSALGGEMFLDGYRRDGTVHTSHPLGGCRMADDGPKFGVVDALGESFRNPNLFVVDGALIPSALCANPSLTIAAVAEKIAADLIAGSGTRSLRDRLSST